MKIDTNNMSFKALYFPYPTKYGAIQDFHISNAVRQNKYIKELAKSEDIIVRFMPKENDFVDLTKKQTLKSVWFTSRIFASSDIKNIEPVEFIRRIEKPFKSARTFIGLLLQGIFHPNQLYFNCDEINCFSRNSDLPKALNNILKYIDNERFMENKKFIEGLIINNDKTAKIVKLF